ncbi:MAG: aminodeoxychorismate synthase component I [Desulfobulbaceae bacterium]|nr:aminodeoxychorismate synthase component I [Desulfobulbaceae bacterium]HIJ89867.1 aminodeoxychorismate synthase component I [Deltaproteobacteria bacterium]
MPCPLTDETLARIMAAAATEDCVFLETSRVTAEEFHSYFFHNPVAHLACYAHDDPARFFRQAEDFLADGLYLAGWLGYEFGYLLEPSLAKRIHPDPQKPLARLGVFRQPLIFAHDSGELHGGSWPVPPPAPASTDYRIANLRPNLTQKDYTAALAAIKGYIESGDTYQVNFTLKLLFDFEGSPEGLYQTLRRNQSVSFGAYLRSGSQRILSFSPELFFKRSGEQCLVRPMKGTIQRGPYPAEDARLARFLQSDEKNRSENVMIVDLLRNDLGRICTPGTVTTQSLFDIETFETLHQMTSTITGHLPRTTNIESLFRALFPCGSVTGAPKIRTMEIIHELENGPRGVYTGAIGFIAPTGEATFNVPIRTIELNDSKGEMGIGSGIIHESDPEQEWRECLLKGRFLSHPAPAFNLIETLLWQAGSGYWLLSEHLERLAASAAYFRFPFSREELLTGLDKMAVGFTASPMRVRLGLAKTGKMELTATPCPAPAAITWPTQPATQSELPKVIFSSQATDPGSPWLFHKTTLRELYDTERQQALAAGFYEVLFANTKGEVTEGSITNIFIQRQGAILTPPMECGLLPGVFRRYLLEHSPLPVREVILTRRDIEQAEALFVGNSIRGVVQVRLA